jgi:hypothetical protein
VLSADAILKLYKLVTKVATMVVALINICFSKNKKTEILLPPFQIISRFVFSSDIIFICT